MHLKDTLLIHICAGPTAKPGSSSASLSSHTTPMLASISCWCKFSKFSSPWATQFNLPLNENYAGPLPAAAPCSAAS